MMWAPSVALSLEMQESRPTYTEYDNLRVDALAKRDASNIPDDKPAERLRARMGG